MNVPKTSSGKDCKLCLKKGGRCHLHGGSPGKSPKRSPNTKSGSFDSVLGYHKRASSKKSSPKRSSPKKIGSWSGEDILDLPKPVLYDFLLEMSGTELRELIKIKKVRDLVSYPEFKRLYDIKHGINSFALGKTRLSEEYGYKQVMIEQKDNMEIDARFHPLTQDDWLLEINIYFKAMTQFTLDFYYKGDSLSFRIENSDNDIVSWTFDKKSKDWKHKDGAISLDKLNDLFISRKKPEWIINNKMDKNIPREIFETFKRLLEKHGVKMPNWPLRV